MSFSSIPLVCFEDFDVLVFPLLEKHGIAFNYYTRNDGNAKKMGFLVELPILYLHKKDCLKHCYNSISMGYFEVYKRYMQKYVTLLTAGMIRYGCPGDVLKLIKHQYIVDDGGRSKIPLSKIEFVHERSMSPVEYFTPR